ncbi:hypothetical protein [Exiguobacterium sp.]|uniref:hypothetical protein n=1 Tax=Exiguobacterium sp. TaxID=44751 RepID=UPI0028AF6952|nr:hypothetical protein [Exiguobacterium sp.]
MTLLELSFVLWISPLLLLAILTLTPLVHPPEVNRMNEELFFHTVERLMWRSTMCERVGDEIRGMDVNPGETAEKWRLVRVQDQLRLKKEQGGELTYARDVKHYTVTSTAEILSIQLNDSKRSFRCVKTDSS